jgi:hypothetical protein
MPLSVSRRVDPALVLIAAAPIITQSKGVIFSAPTVKKDHAISQRRHENCVESNPDALQHMNEHKNGISRSILRECQLFSHVCKKLPPLLGRAGARGWRGRLHIGDRDATNVPPRWLINGS